MRYRHGDLMIKSIKVLPKGIRKIKTNVLAEGEVTGHAHKLVEGDFTVYEDKNGVLYFSANTPVKINHEEHKLKEIDKGVYIVEREREFDPFEEEIKRVRD